MSKKMEDFSLPEQKYDFEAWMKILNRIDINDASSIPQQYINSYYNLFDQFLATFPLLHLFWSKYAHFKYATTGEPNEAIQVFKHALSKNILFYSIEMWNEYLQFVRETIQTPENDALRAAYAEALDSIGFQYKSGSLWISAIQHEISQNRNPIYYFYKAISCCTDLIGKIKEMMQPFIFRTSIDNLRRLRTFSSLLEYIGSAGIPLEPEAHQETEEYSVIIQKFDHQHKKTISELNFIHRYESQITQPFFTFTPPDDAEISIWEQYTDWAIRAKRPLDYIVRIFERALIPCAFIDALWIEYCLFFEDKGLINEAYAVYQRIPYEICHRALSYFFSFEEQYFPGQLEDHMNQYKVSYFVEELTYIIHYFSRHEKTEESINIIQSAIERLKSVGDFQGAGVLHGILIDLTNEPGELIPSSLASILSYVKKVDQDKANEVYFNSVFGTDSGISIEDKVTVAELYLEYTQTKNIDITFQRQLENYLESLKNSLIWHKSRFRRNEIITQAPPEKFQERWTEYKHNENL